MKAYKLSYLELKRYTKKLAVLPTGSLEQHGPYLPLGTDAIVASKIADALEESIGKDLVIFPTLYYGCAKEHKKYPGTVYFEFETYMKMVKEVFQSIFSAGFNKLLVIGCHGGNDQILRVIQADWNYEHEGKKVYYIFAFTEGVKNKSKELFGDLESHAGSVETSIIYSFSKEYQKTNKKKLANKKYVKAANTSYSTHRSDEMNPLGIVTKSEKLIFDPKKGADVFMTQVNEIEGYAKKIIQHN